MKECLTDLSWLPGEGYVLPIVEPLAVLADENYDNLDVLQRMLVRA